MHYLQKSFSHLGHATGSQQKFLQTMQINSSFKEFPACNTHDSGDSVTSKSSEFALGT